MASPATPFPGPPAAAISRRPVFIRAARWTIGGMNEQGGSPTGGQDDWWGQLYDDTTGDTGPTATADSLDDHFASASDALTAEPGTGGAEEPGETMSPPTVPLRTVPAPRGGTRAGGRHPAEGDEDVDVPEASEPKPDDAASGPYDDPRAVPEKLEEPPEPPSEPPRATLRPPSSPDRRSNPSGPLNGSRGLRAPWEPPSATSPGPTTFPAGPVPPGLTEPPEPAQPPQPPENPRLTTPAPALDEQPHPDTDTARAHSTAPATEPHPSANDPRARNAPVPLLKTPLLKDYVGSGPPTYDPDPTALPLADPDDLGDLLADTVLDGARCGASVMRAVSMRGDSARYRGERRRDALLTARFGYGDQALVLVATATGARATAGAHRAAAEVCRWIGRAVGRSHARLAEDMRAARRGDLKSGLHRLTDRSLGRLRAAAAEQGLAPEEYTASLRCLLLSADPECRTRVFFGVGPGGLFRLRDGIWQDIEPAPGEPAHGEPAPGEPQGPSQHPRADAPQPYAPPMEARQPYDTPFHAPFLFRASTARPGDTLLMCSAGLADPLHGEAELAGYLTGRWSGAPAPGLADFLADVQVRVKGYADDRTAVAVWET